MSDQNTVSTVRGTASQIPILMYHALFADPEDFGTQTRAVTRYWVSVDAFERQISALADQGYSTIPLGALIGGAPAPNVPKPLILTFDDGWASDYRLARRVLARFAWRSEHFVTVGWIGMPGFMSWSELLELANAGAGIHSHSMTHRNLDRLALPEVYEELERSKATLEARLARPVDFLALPSGTGNDPAVRDLARGLGYKGICTSRVGVNRPGDDPYALQRIPVTLHTQVTSLVARVGGQGLSRLAVTSTALRTARRVLGPRLYEGGKDLFLRARGTP